MGEKGIRPWAFWERCERRQGAEALSRLAGELPDFFADSRLVSSRWSRLPFYASHRLMELKFVRDQDAERALVLHGPGGTWWLNGQSAPIHDVNEAESLALTKSTMCDYIRFFFYFVRGGEDAFVLIESADEVGRRSDEAGPRAAEADPRANADAGGEDEDDEEEEEEELEPLTLEAARDRARPLLSRGVDEAGRWVVDAAVAYDGVLFCTSLALAADGLIEMTNDESAGTLYALMVPKGPSLELPSATPPVEPGVPTAPPRPDETISESPTGDLGSAFGHSTGPRTGTSELFVGRTNEQDEFRRVLELASGAAGLPDEAHVVVAHGLGGIGKSSLLRRLHDTAGPPRRGGPLVTEIINCEDEQQWRNPGDYAGLGGPPIWKLLDRLYAAIEAAGAADRQLKSQVDKAFKDFRKARTAQPDLVRRARELGIVDLFGHRQLTAEQLSAVGQTAVGTAQIIAGAVSVPLPHVGIPLNAAASTVGTVVRAAKLRREGPVNVADYQALVADLDRLVGQFARSLKELSRSVGPVVIFIDTGELLGDALGWLCDASRHSGSRVVWVLGLRLGDEADRFLGTIHEARLRPMALTRFDSRTVDTYLRRRLGDRFPAGLDIAAVTELTHGIPLAVFLVSTLLRDGQDPASALAPFQDGEVNSVIQRLAERYLTHANNTEELRSDLPLLQGLALLYGDVGQSGDTPGSARRDPDALAALWGVPVGTVAASLDALAERHDFVLRSGRRLHQEVQRAVLLSLLEPFEQAKVRDMNIRAADLYRERAAAAGHRTVDAQLADQGWQTAVIALLWHTFWIDLGRGLQMLKGLFAAAVIDDSFAAALVGVAAFFEPACTDDGQRQIGDLRLVTELQLTFNPSKTRRDRAAASARDVARRLKGCPAEPLLASAPPAAAYYDLLQGSYHDALGLAASDWAALLLRAAGDVEPGGATALAVTSQARELAAGLAEDYSSAPAGTQQAIISALGLITRFDPGDSIARNNLGNELFSLGRYAEAEAAYAEALSLDPGNAVYQNNRGTALSGLQRHDQAEAAYRKALGLDADDADIQRNLGIELTFMGRYAEAEAVYREALRLNPRNATHYDDLGGALFGLGRYAEAEAACRKALELDPSYVSACNGLGYALFRLGRWAEAEAAYRDAPRLNPNDADGHHGLGRMYLKVLGRVDEAGVEVREALRLDPGYVNAHATLGSLYVITGELDAARSSFLQATQSAAGKHAFSELMLGALDGRTDRSAAAGHFADALAALDRPHQPIILTPFDRAEVRAMALAALGRDREATDVFERAVRDRSAADVFQRQHYELLSASAPATGVDALIGIWRDVIAADGSAAGPWGEPSRPALSSGQPDGC
jgi:tetratricopeptide (TPR) repeat protein